MSLAELRALERDHVMPTYARQPVEFVRGEGTRLWDADGDEYLDFLTGISVVQIGHCHPALVDAIADQAARLIQVGNLFYNAPAMRLARRLSERSLGGKVFFTNSGAEAIECALKLARKRRTGGGFVVMEGGFHGRTMGALSATPQESKQEPFAPLVPGFRVVPRENPAFEEVVDERTAAVIVEPVQGESGIWPVADEALAAARSVCDETGALLVFDEVQCGMGRTGSLWAWQRAGVRPDVMTLAKGLGGGLPIGACLASPDHSDVFEPGDHGSTFAGSPLVAAAANAVLDVVDDDAFLAEVARKGELLRDGLAGLGLDVRGAGLMLAFRADDGPGLVRRALVDQRLVLNAPAPDAVRLLPPLTVSDEEIAEAIERIGRLVG